jgi:ADP-dependent phosphofructokinase/glucokinase
MSLEQWEKLYRAIRQPLLKDTLTGFNMNLDRIIPVTRELLDGPSLSKNGLRELRERLITSMQYCTAEEWFVPDAEQYRQFTRSFSQQGNLIIGGQAGIAALHLSRLGVNRVICAVPYHGRESEAILKSRGIIVPDLIPSGHEGYDLEHLVFEYPPGLVPLAKGASPRNNRFIVSPAHDPSSVLLPDACMGSFLSASASCRRAFLSGYQYLRSADDFVTAAGQIAEIREINPDMRVHIEWVSVTDAVVLEGCLQHILPCADSVGLNENELHVLLRHLGTAGIFSDRGETGQLSPVPVIQGALKLFRHLNLMRLHVHTFGYYVLVRNNNRGDPAVSRNALLFAAREVASVAGGTGAALSSQGMQALSMAEGLLEPSVSPGIFLTEDCTVIVIPTLIAQDITRTTGLGDILSSAAFIADEF